FWDPNLKQTEFNAGLCVDDVVAHEWTHGLVSNTANLFYQNESGQLNESYADVFGELVDLFNGNVAFAGLPVGPNWPPTGSGPATDTPNNSRTGCSLPPTSPDVVRWMLGEAASAPGLPGAIRD